MKTARLFQNGQSQAVRLPKAFRLPGDKVYIKKVGNREPMVCAYIAWDPSAAVSPIALKTRKARKC